MGSVSSSNQLCLDHHVILSPFPHQLLEKRQFLMKPRIFLVLLLSEKKAISQAFLPHKENSANSIVIPIS